jgi:hypothetical protein
MQPVSIEDCSISYFHNKYAIESSWKEWLRTLKRELMRTLRDLCERIKTLETERVNLMIEVEKLKKIADSKLNTLESEVNTLREQVKALADLLDYAEETGK